MDYQDGIKVNIGNWGYRNEGDLRNAWITLPKTDQEIKDFLEENGLYDEQHEETYISEYDEAPFGLDDLFGEYTNLEGVNLLAKQVSMAHPADLEKVEAYLQAEDAPDTVLELMNLIEQADGIVMGLYDYEGSYRVDEWGQTELHRNSNEENYGRTLVTQNWDLKNVLQEDEEAMSAFDFERYGRLVAEKNNIELLENCYIDTVNTKVSLDEYDMDAIKEKIEFAYEAGKDGAAENKDPDEMDILKPSGTYELKYEGLPLPKEGYGIDQMMADLCDDIPAAGEDGPGGR